MNARDPEVKLALKPKPSIGGCNEFFSSYLSGFDNLALKGEKKTEEKTVEKMVQEISKQQ